MGAVEVMLRADVLLERPRSNCGACSICSRYICPGVYQHRQVGPDYLTTRSPPTALRRALLKDSVFAMEWSLLDYFRQEMLVHERLLVRLGQVEAVKARVHRSVSRTLPPRCQGLPLSILAAHQRQRHSGRACPCERVFHAQVCALHRTHISILAARQRQCHDGRACPCDRVFHAQVCALTALYSCSASKTAPRRQGLPPASVCSTLRCVHFKSHTSLFSQHVKDMFSQVVFMRERERTSLQRRYFRGVWKDFCLRKHIFRGFHSPICKEDC